MTRYSLELTTSAAKEFRALPAEVKPRFQQTLDALLQNPRPSGVRKLKGFMGLYRLRLGPYRLIYKIDDRRNQVLVTRIRHRREAYR